MANESQPPALNTERLRVVGLARTTNDLLDAQNELSMRTEMFLRSNGWASSCNYPGGVWLWSRMWRDREVAVPLDLAIKMHRWHVEEIPEDEDSSEPDTGL